MPLFVDTPFGRYELQGDASAAQSWASRNFEQDTDAARIEEILGPGDRYTAKIYTYTRDAHNHRREILIARISTDGFKPQIPTIAKKEGQP
jgi:hypothetical protein